LSRVVWNADVVKRAVLGAVNAGLSGVGAEVEREARSIFGVGHGGVASKPGQPPNTQRGRLRSSVAYALRNDLSVRVGTNVPYGLYLEKGATIRAKGKNLAIPMSASVKMLVARGISPRQIIEQAKADKSKPVRFVKTKRGGVLVIKEHRGTSRAGKGKRSEVLFLLTPRVTIAPRPWLRPAFQRAKPRLVKRFTAEANRAFRGGLRVAASGGAR
jgi:hypothetical protein